MLHGGFSKHLPQSSSAWLHNGIHDIEAFLSDVDWSKLRLKLQSVFLPSFLFHLLLLLLLVIRVISKAPLVVPMCIPGIK